MVALERNYPLVSLNTFGFAQAAEHYAEADDEHSLVELIEHAERRGWPLFVLGSGSNVVLTRDVPGLTLRYTADAVDIDPPGPSGATRVVAKAGRAWHSLVELTLARGVPGLENLSLIPGTVGAAPVQNIGAYGVELSERIVSVRAWHRPEHRFRTLGADECRFEYRDSRFKRERGDWIITEIELELGNHLSVESDYASLSGRLATDGITEPNALDVARAVVAVRRERLPDPLVIGNAGSFFQNPVVSGERAAELLIRFPDMVQYPLSDGRTKIAAGWLIDQLGFRGWRENDVGVHSEQALVLTNLGNGNGESLMRLATRIGDSVRERYGITLVPEPVIV